MWGLALYRLRGPTFLAIRGVDSNRRQVLCWQYNWGSGDLSDTMAVGPVSESVHTAVDIRSVDVEI